MCYDVVKNIDLKRYRFTEDVFVDMDCRDRSRLGWIAQEVEGILPKAIGVQNFVCADGRVIDDCLSLDPSQLYAATFGATKKLIEKVEQKTLFSGTGTIETGTLLTVISVSGVTWDPMVQVTPIFNVNTGIRNLNVSVFDIESNSFTVYGGPGDFFWTLTS